jgi:hypothetical protein
LPNEPWAVWQGSDKISTHLHQDVYDGIHNAAAKEVWAESGWVDPEVENLVDMEVLKQAAKGLSVPKRI